MSSVQGRVCSAFVWREGGREGGREGRMRANTILQLEQEGGELDHSYVSFHMGRSSHRTLGNHHILLSDTPTLCTCA